MVRQMSTIRTVAAVEAQTITPKRQLRKLSRLKFCRSRPYFVAVLVEALWQFDKPSNGIVPDFMDAVSECVMGALRLPRMAEHKRANYPIGSVISKSLIVDRSRAGWVSVRHLRGGPTPQGIRGLLGGQAMQRTAVYEVSTWLGSAKYS